MTSITCCQGLVEFGLLNSTLLFFDHDLIQSGISLSSDQSPPPITFPARTELIKILFCLLLKKDFTYELIACSALALDAL